MDTNTVLFIIVLIFLGYYYLVNQSVESFSGYNVGYGPFKPIEETRSVDPLVCFPGTYWRNGTYYDLCKKMSAGRPMRMDVEGNSYRAPEAKYEMVCSVDDHLNRNCQFVKIYNKFY